MPARRATSSVDEPRRPCSAKTASAASRISSRRSSFYFRCETTMTERLVMTHYVVKSLGDTVEIGLGEPCVERQGERPLEDPVGSREGLGACIGGEPVESVGADLRLDSPSAQVGEYAVPIVDLDHVGLPTMDVALVGARQED